MPIAALILDFDGLIADTESLEHTLWSEIYLHAGSELPLDDWLAIVGHSTAFDPLDHLAARLGQPVDRDGLLLRYHQRKSVLLPQLQPRPGVRELLEAATAARWPIGVASNSPASWVEPNLRRLGLHHHFHTFRTRDRVTRPKPDPEPYALALRDLGADPAHSFAFEDSQPGIASARAAGLHVIAVPNPLTRHQDLSAAHRILPSLENFPLPPRHDFLH